MRRTDRDEVVHKLLATRGEGAMHEVCEVSRVRDPGLPLQTDDGGVDFRGWRERARGHRESPDRRGVILNEHGERTVVFGAGLRPQALGDFLLEHDRDVEDVFARGDEVLQERRGDVVGQVADDVEWCAGELGEIGVECVAFDDFDVARHGGAQLRDEVAVDFDRDDAARGGSEFTGKGAGSGSDFDNGVTGGDAGKPNDALEDVAIGKEVLAVALLQKRPVRDSNPCYSLERAVSWTGLDERDRSNNSRSL